MVWFDNPGQKHNLVRGILKHIEDLQNVGRVTKEIGFDSVWFDSRIPQLQKTQPKDSKINNNEDNKSVVDMDPLLLKVDGNGLSPDVFKDEVKQVPIKDEERWRKSIESNEKVIIRI